MSAVPKVLPMTAVPMTHHRFTIEAYDEMVAHGILTSGDRVELLAGEIVEMPPIGSRHSGCVARLNHLFASALLQQATIFVQNPVQLLPDSEPEPDVALLKPRADFYDHAHPRSGDILLLVEVAESSLAYDREVKLPIYAAAGIREVWIIDLVGKAIEVYTDPTGRRYAAVRRLRRDETFSPAAFPGFQLRASDVIGCPDAVGG